MLHYFNLYTLFVTLICFIVPLNAKEARYPLAVTTMFRDEARFLKEFIEYYRLMGATHFYLYNNLSVDNYREVLEPYVKMGLVELIEWPHQAVTTAEFEEFVHCAAYNDALKRSKNCCRWLAVLDSDEFLVPVQGDTLLPLLNRYEKYGGVAVHWQMFGTSGVNRIAPNELLIEKLLIRAPANYAENVFIKSIVRPERIDRFIDPHLPQCKEPYFIVNTKGKRVHKSMAFQILTDVMRLHHYWTRDEAFLFEVKVARRGGWLEGADGVLARSNRLNQELDPTMLRFVPSLRARMGFSK